MLRFDPSLRHGSDDLPLTHRRLKKNVTFNFPKPPSSMWISWVTADIFDAFDRWKERGSLLDVAYKKVKLMCSYCKKHNEEEVHDPYYGGPQGFEEVWIFLKMPVDHCSIA